MTHASHARAWRQARTLGALAVSFLTACGGVSRSGTSVVGDAGANDSGLATLPDAGDSSAPCTWTERAILSADPPITGAGFGTAVALDERFIIIGASAYPSAPGSAYVFDENGATWVPTERLSGGGTDLDSFGAAAAVSGDWLVVGEPTAGRNNHAANIGGVFFFARNGSSWFRHQFVAPSGLSTFGDSVALSGSLAAVGGTNPVTAFRQEGTGWIEDGTISVPGDLLTVVALSGDTLAVGVPDDPERGEHAGAVHVFRRQASMASTYAHEAELLGSNIAMYSQFGESMAIEGDVLAVGASSDATVYIFERAGDQWTQASVLSSPHPTSEDSFGYSIALDGTRLAVGAPQAFGAGTVHLYEKVGAAWEYRTEVRSSRPIVSLGASVALHGNLLVAGAPQDGVGRMYTGSAVVWECLAP